MTELPTSKGPKFTEKRKIRTSWKNTYLHICPIEPL